MTLIGILLAVAGALGLLANVTGIYLMTGMAGDLRIWGGITIVGVATAMLTRRARD
jgi:hypothetical protein